MDKLDILKFTKKHDYLLCIDSDGTVIDAMTSKHMFCHGPALIHVWGLENHADEVQKIWNQINLFNVTRGVNRFIALVELLEQINGVYLVEKDLEILKKWVHTTNNLANGSLEKEYVKKGQPILKKALDWSNEVNDRILKLSYKDKPPYDGVKEFLEFAKDQVDLALISSSNMSALIEEWTKHDLIKYLDVLTSQETGTKGECINKLLQKGYDPTHVLMIGDANPDLDAAKENNTFFYPILTQKETISWKELQIKFFNLFITDQYQPHQQLVIRKFIDNFAR